MILLMNSDPMLSFMVALVIALLLLVILLADEMRINSIKSKHIDSLRNKLHTVRQARAYDRKTADQDFETLLAFIQKLTDENELARRMADAKFKEFKSDQAQQALYKFNKN